jgi:hypothetical protein
VVVSTALPPAVERIFCFTNSHTWHGEQFLWRADVHLGRRGVRGVHVRQARGGYQLRVARGPRRAVHTLDAVEHAPAPAHAKVLQDALRQRIGDGALQLLHDLAHLLLRGSLRLGVSCQRHAHNRVDVHVLSDLHTAKTTLVTFARFWMDNAQSGRLWSAFAKHTRHAVVNKSLSSFRTFTTAARRLSSISFSTKRASPYRAPAAVVGRRMRRRGDGRCMRGGCTARGVA